MIRTELNDVLIATFIVAICFPCCACKPTDSQPAASAPNDGKNTKTLKFDGSCKVTVKVPRQELAGIVTPEHNTKSCYDSYTERPGFTREWPCNQEGSKKTLEGFNKIMKIDQTLEYSSSKCDVSGMRFGCRFSPDKSPYGTWQRIEWRSDYVSECPKDITAPLVNGNYKLAEKVQPGT